MYEELQKLNSKNTKNSVKKWTQDLHRHSIKEVIQVANKYMKRQGILCVIMELQTETMNCCYHVLEWLKSMTLMIASADEDVGQQELSFTAGENEK